MSSLSKNVLTKIDVQEHTHKQYVVVQALTAPLSLCLSLSLFSISPSYHLFFNPSFPTSLYPSIFMSSFFSHILSLSLSLS